jgi:beta-lactamase regulating signal transducer with metallopeptidase domain
MNLAALILVAAVKGSVFLVVAAIVMRALPRMSAALRHLIWASALGGLVLMPLFVPVVPSVQSRFVPSIPVVIARAPTTPVALKAPALTAASAAEHVTERHSSLRSERQSSPAPVTYRASLIDPSSHRPIDFARWFAVVWAGVAVALLLRIAIGRLRLALLARNASVVDDGEWLLVVQRLAHRLDIARPITLLCSAQSCAPMTWGIVYPTVLLPVDANDWSLERRTIVLLHELAHVSRLDALTQLLAQVTTAVFWFNPLCWIASRAMRVERELACDDCVLATGARASDYAYDLLQLARSRSTSSNFAVAALAMAHRGDLEDRLTAILDPGANRAGVSRSRTIAAALAIVALALPLAALAPASVNAAEPSSAEVPAREVPEPTKRSEPAGSSALVPRSTTVAPRQPQQSVSAQVPMTQLNVAMVQDGSVIAHVPAPLATLPRASIAATRSRSSEPDRETLLSVAQAALKLTSGYDKAELLVPIARYYVADEKLATAYLTAAASISGDHDCARAIVALFKPDAPLADRVIELAMQAASARMTSDFEKANVITTAIGVDRTLGPDARTAIIAAIRTLQTSYERRVTISAFAKRGQFNTTDAIGLINAAAGLTSSYDRAEALIDIAAHSGLDDAGVRQAYAKAAESITSSSDYRRAVAALLKRP